MGIAHFDTAIARSAALGHLGGRWTDLGTAAGSVTVGLARIQVHDGAWSTPAHEHGQEEEIFYVLAGRGLAWQDGATTEIGPGDAIAFLPGDGAHTLHGISDLDVLAFGPRHQDESPGFPRLGLSLVGRRAVETVPGTLDGVPIQWRREAELGPPDLPAQPALRPATIVNLADVEPASVARPRVQRTRRNLAGRLGTRAAGLQHTVVAPGKASSPQHCHSIEEELFVILEGDGALILDDQETPVSPGNVIGRPAASGVSHNFRAGRTGLTYLAYGTRDPGDVCYYPRSNKIAFRGVGVVARVEKLDYWDGED